MSEEKSEGGSSVGGFVQTAAALYDLLKKIRSDVILAFEVNNNAKLVNISTALLGLRFERTYFREVLVQIEKGEFSETDLKKLGFMLLDTNRDVENLLRLVMEREKKLIVRRKGAKFLEMFDRLIIGPKSEIRQKIYDIEHMKLRTKADRSQLAKEILSLIDAFNERLAVVCDELSPPIAKS